MDHQLPTHRLGHERLPARQETFVYWSMIIVMTRRLARLPARAA